MTYFYDYCGIVLFSIRLEILSQPMHEERPLATTYSGDRQSGWMKTKLLMRLSFSTSNSRPSDRFNSMQKNSETIDEKDESENVLTVLIL